MRISGAQVRAAPAPVTTSKRLQLALVVWNGGLGGAEAVQAMLAREWRRAGVDASVVFVTSAGPLTERLDAYGVPYTALGVARGRDVFLAPRRLARVVADAGSDGAVVADGGYLSAVLRAGGYRGRIVGAEHGKLLTIAALPRWRRVKDHLERLAGAPFRAVDVGVSEFIVREMRRHPHARRIERIYNGVDLDAFSPGPGTATERAQVVVGCAARLVPGKGVDDLLRAASHLRDAGVAVHVAGDGPERPGLEALADELDVRGVVELVGRVPDMPAFWRACDVAVVPSDEWIESFSMSTLEAMACGVPVVQPRRGAFTEMIEKTGGGLLVPPGDPEALADALYALWKDRELAEKLGERGFDGVRAHYSIQRSADKLLDVYESLKAGGFERARAVCAAAGPV
jgi:glycosyltransferase involved in cell wall biosynthesis